MAPDTEFDVVNRLRSKYNMRMQDFAYLVHNENGEPLSPNIMGTWSTRGTLSRSIPNICDSFFWSSDFIYGKSREKWRDDLLAARAELRSWARQQDMTNLSVSRRFVAVWEKWQTLIPMREEIWAVLTYMAEFVTAKFDPNTPVHISTWLGCKQGTYTPGRVQIDGAADMTGLPNRWWYTGNSVYLRDFTAEELEILRNAIFAQGNDVDDVVGAMNALKVNA